MAYNQSRDNEYTKVKDVTTGDPTPLQGTGGAAHVRPISGTGKTNYIRSLITTTRGKVEFPAGSDIKEIQVFAWAHTSGANDFVNDHLMGVLTVDAPNDTVANAWIHNGTSFSGGTMPSSATDDQNFYIIPLGRWVVMPFTAALSEGTYSGGRIDMKSSDEATGLNWVIIGA